MGGGRSQRYRRRRPLPALIVLLALALIAMFVWIKVFSGHSGPANGISCAPPSGPPATAAGQPPTTLGQPLEHDALDRTSPVPPSQVLVRVLNGSIQHGQAGETTEALRQLGFAQVGQPGDDPLYNALKNANL